MKKWMIRALSALLIVAFLPTTVLAAEWNLDNGSIEITAAANADGGTTQTVSQGGGSGVEDSNPIITSNSNQTNNTITINAGDGTTANVTIKDTNIDTSGTDKAAIKTEGEGNVNLNVEGTNTVTSSKEHAGVEKTNDGNLTIGSESGNGKLTANGGDWGAGIGGGAHGDGSHITITGGEITANGGSSNYGYGGAGIGGGGGVGFGGNGSDITITGGKVTANGGAYSAGIGGGGNRSGSHITITSGEVTANGGIGGGAGIGGGDGGDGSHITITDGKVTANGGAFGAGIGGGSDHGDGSDITISGGEVTANGGGYAAGIGGGWYGNGREITISGGEVTANGGSRAAGIGGGWYGNGSDITISGDSKVKATGGDKLGTGAACGAAIGNGGNGNSDGPVDGREIVPNTTGLYTTGKVERTHGDGTVLPTIFGKVEPPKPDEPENSASAEEEEPLYWVLHLDRSSLVHQEQKTDGVLALTAKADGAILTGKLWGLGVLRSQGIEKITFTDGTHSAELVLADLIAKGQPGDVYVLTLGAENTLTLNGEAIDF